MKCVKITEANLELEGLSKYYYGAGKKLKVGDTVYNGFIVHRASTSTPEETALELKLFTEQNGLIYELYLGPDEVYIPAILK